MRMDLRLRGKTSSGRACLMDLTVYASSQKKFTKAVKERSREGPWFYDGTADLVPETEKITVEHVEHLNKPRDRKQPP